jgi:hypothetical protein
VTNRRTGTFSTFFTNTPTPMPLYSHTNTYTHARARGHTHAHTHTRMSHNLSQSDKLLDMYVNKNKLDIQPVDMCVN